MKARPAVAVPQAADRRTSPGYHSNIRLVDAAPTKQTDERTRVKAAVTQPGDPQTVQSMLLRTSSAYNYLLRLRFRSASARIAVSGSATFPHQDVSAQRRRISFLIRFVDTSGGTRRINDLTQPMTVVKLSAQSSPMTRTSISYLEISSIFCPRSALDYRSTYRMASSIAFRSSYEMARFPFPALNSSLKRHH